MDLTRFPRIPLAHLPTPLQPLPRLSEHLGGPRLYAKRDDLTGLGVGGNKVRKLEFELAAARAAGADALVMTGAVQSNAVRQAAAAAARLGIPMHAVLMIDRVPRTEDEYLASGNVMLTRLFGATVVPCSVRDDPDAVAADVASRLEKDGLTPHVIAYGVSSPTGALGYAAAAAEMAAQFARTDLTPAAVVHASGSAGTQAGLVVGAATHLPGTRVIGVDVDAQPDRVQNDVLALTEEVAALAGTPAPGAEKVEVVGGYAGPAYGAVTPGVIEAIRALARLEGLVVDPVYSGKGAAGLIGLIRSGRFSRDDTVVFIHTGGSPGLYAYRPALSGDLGLDPA
jgi:L-cysteate sulfo-lyase